MKLSKSATLRLPLLCLITGTALSIFTLPACGADNAENSNATEHAAGRFDIARYEVEGNTLLASSAIQDLLKPYTGSNRDFGDVQRALETLESAYRQRGFNLVQVVLPEQELNQGVVRFRVVETKIGKVTIEGNRFFDQANIRHSVPGLSEGKIPNIADVSASLRAANESPSKKTSLALQRGEQDDEIDAVLKVTDEKPWKLGASLDNNGNDSTGKSQIGVSYQHANVFGLDHVLSLQYITTFEKPSQVGIYGAGYHVPLYELGDSVDLFASYSDVDSGLISAGLVDLQVSGKGSVFGGRYNHNLRRIGNLESKLVYGLDYKAYRNNVMLLGNQLGSDVTVHPVSLAYTGIWKKNTSEAGFTLTAVHNLPGGDRGGSADFNRTRIGAPAGYSLLRYGLSYGRTLPADWQLRMSMNGQYTRDSLVPGEQFGAGGASSVRGFTEREIANDNGHASSIEVYTPNVCSGVERVAAQCRLLAFYDNAHVSRNNPLPGEQSQASIGSVGLGLRLVMDKYLTFQMDYGQAIDAGPVQAKGDKRLHFRLALSY